jgi:hypothetical protein
MHRFLSILLLALLYSSCAKKLHPPTESYAVFWYDNQWMKIRISPYVNAMPGSSSEDVIIPIRFELENQETFSEWPRKLKITGVRMPGKKASRADLDHQHWLTHAENGNVIRIPEKEIGRVFHLTLRFKDDHGKRYKVTFYNQGAGVVY